jgi:hypothetical protein
MSFPFFYPPALEHLETLCTVGTYQSILTLPNKSVVIPAINDSTSASLNIHALMLDLPIPTVYVYIDQLNGNTVSMIVRNEMLISGLNFMQNTFTLTGLYNSTLNGLTFSQLDQPTQSAITGCLVRVELFNSGIIPGQTWVPAFIQSHIFNNLIS